MYKEAEGAEGFWGLPFLPFLPGEFALTSETVYFGSAFTKNSRSHELKYTGKRYITLLHCWSNCLNWRLL